jgi:4-amino-4-deoxychorismate lyase
VNKKYLETIRAVDGIVFNLEYHQNRYESVLKDIGAKSIQDLKNVLNPPNNGIYRCRVVYDDKTIKASYHKYIKRKVSSLKLIYNDNIDYSKKYENREAIDNLFLQKNDCDDILIVKNSLITDTSIANIAFYDGKNWLTPKKPLLDGTTRKRLIDNGFLAEVDIRVKDINNFYKIALMNAMIDFDIIAQENIRDIIC